MKTILTMTAITVVFSAVAFGDIARPDKPKSTKSIDTMLSIKLDHDAKEAKLIIPASQIKQLRAQLDQLDGSNDTAAASTIGGGFTRMQTIVSGVFLSLAIVFGGIWFTRSGWISTKGGKAAAGLMFIFATGAFATVAFANAGPPAEARSITGKMFTPAVHMYGFGSGSIKLQLSNDADFVTLVVPDPKEAKPAGEE